MFISKSGRSTFQTALDLAVSDMLQDETVTTLVLIDVTTF